MFKSFTDKDGKRWTACAECNRGGNGNAQDKCSCGWQHTELNGLGCYMGECIVGEPKKPIKISRSKKRYQEFLNDDSFCGTFCEWLGIKPKNGRRYV